MERLKCINSNTLKILAMIFMLVDHMWGTIIPENNWMTMIGRLSFPIFAFLIVEGFTHTSDLKKYLKRLFIFALLSEIPFNLAFTDSIFYPFHQNVMFTLLLGVLCISEIEKIKNNKNLKTGIFSALKIALYLSFAMFGFVDYGVIGIFVIIAFYIFKDFKLAWLGQLISLIMIFIVWFEGQMILVNIFSIECEFPIQGIGVLSLIFIWLYNGERGVKNKFIQYAFYAFYPVHLLVLYSIYHLMMI